MTTDVAAAYRILTTGRRAAVFIDDRYDMYPVRVTKDYFRLFEGRPESLDLLDAYRAEAVLWPADAPLTGRLANAPAWRRAAQRQGWSLYVRAG